MGPCRKHIIIKHHNFQSFVVNGDVKIKHVNTKEQITYIFTKPLDSKLFGYLPYKIIVLVEDCVAGAVYLCEKKEFGIENYGHEVVGSSKFFYHWNYEYSASVWWMYLWEYHTQDTCSPQSAPAYWGVLRVKHRPTILVLKPSQH